MKAVVVDLCGTLILENTTHGLFGALPFSPQIALRTRLWKSRLGHLVNSIVGKDVAREELMRSLRGWPREALEGYAKTYVHDVLERKTSPLVRRGLADAREEGALIYLATSSLEPIAAAIVEAFSLDGYVASTLEFDPGGRCTGKLASDITGIKWSKLRERFPAIQDAEITVYTDNPEDTDLKDIACHFHFMNEQSSS
jgi:phosphoserine phosphatase